MIAEYRQQSNKFLWIGIIVSTVCNVIKFGATENAQYASYGGAAGFGALIGTLIFLYGCILYAKAKGYEWYYGFIGALGLVGLLILYFFKDKSDSSPQNPQGPQNVPGIK